MTSNFAPPSAAAITELKAALGPALETWDRPAQPV
jgi:hypothetical protein